MEQILKELNDIDKFILARWCYSIGTPVISDVEYNNLLHALEVLLPDNEYVNRSWSSDPCPVELLKRIGREDLIRKVILGDKTESIPSLNTDTELQAVLGNISGPGTLSMKHDGWNVQANFYNGQLVNMQTRGRSSDFMNVDGLREYIPNTIKYSGSCRVVFELTVSKANFVQCAKMFNNVSPRTAVASILARPEYYHLLSLTALHLQGVDLQGQCKFMVLEDCGFRVPMYKEVNNFVELYEALGALSDAEEVYPEPTDGAVYEGQLTRAIRLLAWEEPVYKSFVTGYLEQYGPNRISPSVYIEPVLRKGTNQRRVSMTNWQRIIDYHLQRGAPVAFRVASSATADFDEETTRLLHKEWEGRWEEYQEMVKAEEVLRRCQQNLYLCTHG